MESIKKVLLVATVQSHIAQFHRPLIRILKENGYEIHVAARDNLAEKNGLIIQNVDKKFNIPFERSPLDKKNVTAYKQLKKIMNENQYDVVSCNTPVGGIVARLAARKSRKVGTKVFYTAHGFHFYKGAPKKNWMIYYPIEKFMARFTDALITITKEDFELAQRKKFKTMVNYIHGVGADAEKYLSINSEENEKFRKDNGYDGKFVILCTGELNSNKNQKTVIKAVQKIREKYPNVLLLLAGNGSEENNINLLMQELHMENSVILLGYHTDLEKYTNACDLVVSASFREGLPLNIMEAMLCGKPVVASKNRGHRELIQDGQTGFLVDANDVDEFALKIEELMINLPLREKFILNGKNFIEKFTMDEVERELMNIYLLD